MRLNGVALMLVPLALARPHQVAAQAHLPTAPAGTISPYSAEHPAWKLPFQAREPCPRFRGHSDGAGRYYYLDYELRQPAMQVTGNPRPRWPGRPGRVELEFVVDTEGTVDPRSVRVLRSDAPELAPAVIDILRSWFFTPPLTVGGCRVRQQVRHSFSFAQ